MTKSPPHKFYEAMFNDYDQETWELVEGWFEAAIASNEFFRDHFASFAEVVDFGTFDEKAQVLFLTHHIYTRCKEEENGSPQVDI